MVWIMYQHCLRCIQPAVLVGPHSRDLARAVGAYVLHICNTAPAIDGRGLGHVLVYSPARAMLAGIAAPLKYPYRARLL
jgi:hypothetical protein